MSGSKTRKTKVINKELVAEDWCFVCKDGGNFRICDYRQCLKSYHPHCVGKDNSFLDSEDNWICNWHTCFLCSRSSYRHCYTCAKAVCRHCFPTANFLKVKGIYGFCSHCRKLALLVEGNKDCDSDGEQVDFKDRETYEGLFKEYYQIIKENEGFEIGHIYAALDREKVRKNYEPGSGSLEYDEAFDDDDDDDDDEDEEDISEYDCSDHEYKHKRKLKLAKQSHIKSTKKEFKLDTELKLTKNKSDYGVPPSFFAAINVDNVKLVYLKRSLLYELLKHPESFEEKVIGCFVRVKSDPYEYCAKKSHQLMQVNGIKSISDGESGSVILQCFSAALKDIHISHLSDHDFSEEECAELRQKMLAGLLMKPTVFELQQKARVLHVDLTEHWIIKELALLQKFIDRANERGMRRELSQFLEMRKRLQTPSEQARLLKTFPTVIPEISDLHPNSDNSIYDAKIDDNSIRQCTSTVPKYGWKDNATSEEKGSGGHGLFLEANQSHLKSSRSGQSKHICAPNAEFEPFRPASEEKGNKFGDGHFGNGSHVFSRETEYGPRISKGREGETVEAVEFKDDEDANGSMVSHVLVNEKTIPEGEKPRSIEQNGENNKYSIHGICTEELQSPKTGRESQESVPAQVIELLLTDDENGANNMASSDPKGQNFNDQRKTHEPATTKNQESTQIEVINLVSDDEDENANESEANSVPEDQVFDDLESDNWCVVGPNGEQEKCSMTMLKRWSEISPYAFKFKVWKEEQNKENAIWLRDAIKLAFPKQ